MDQHQAPVVEALASSENHPVTGFGVPGHGHGSTIPGRLRRLVGAKAFKADLLTVKGVEDRTESTHALFRAQELAAEAWGADLCRFVTGGSTQSLHSVLASLARAGDTVLLAENAHKSEWAYALAAGLDAVPVPVGIDHDYDIQTVVDPATLENALTAYPHAKAVVIVSPNYFGVTSDIAGLAKVAHARGIPLVVDAAWGGAFAFSPRLPADALALGADIEVCSLHKTMTALGQGSVILARGDLVDQQRLALAYELFETTSPSVPILASIDATRRDHATGGEAIWDAVLDRAQDARARIGKIPGLRVWEADRLPPNCELDPSAILIDCSELGVAGYAIDDWLYQHHHIAMGLSEARLISALVLPGTSSSQIRKLVRALTDLSRQLRRDPSILPRQLERTPRIGAVSFDRAMPLADAFFAEVEEVLYEECAGRVAAEIIAPTPPGVPRVIPGQRISAAHRDWLVANRDAGMFVLDPTDPAERRIRVVKAEASRPLLLVSGETEPRRAAAL